MSRPQGRENKSKHTRGSNEQGHGESKTASCILSAIFFGYFAKCCSAQWVDFVTVSYSLIEWFFISFDLLTGDCTAQKYHKVWLILRTLNSGIRRSLSFSIDYFVFLSELQKSTKIRSRVVSQSAVLATIR